MFSPYPLNLFNLVNLFNLFNLIAYVSGMTKPKTILEWIVVNTKFSWGMFFLVGGGAAVGEACKVSEV